MFKRHWKSADVPDDNRVVASLLERLESDSAVLEESHVCAQPMRCALKTDNPHEATATYSVCMHQVVRLYGYEDVIAADRTIL